MILPPLSASPVWLTRYHPLQRASTWTSDKRRLNTGRISVRYRIPAWRKAAMVSLKKVVGSNQGRNWTARGIHGYLTRARMHIHIYPHVFRRSTAISATIAVRICMHAAPRSFQGTRPIGYLSPLTEGKRWLR